MNGSSDSKRGCSLGEAARALGMSERQLYTELCRGRLRGKTVDGAVRVNQDALAKYKTRGLEGEKDTFSGL